MVMAVAAASARCQADATGLPPDRRSVSLRATGGDVLRLTGGQNPA
jgi:hypothetical protein